jgi:release factor glutamine methyltransferase
MLELEQLPADATGPRADASMREGAARLSASGIDGALTDARRLLLAATGRSPEDLIAHPELPLTRGELARFDAMVMRRCRREPVARILGEREFYGRPFYVTPDVLDPRADSETLIEAALASASAKGWRERPIRILDIGTGSGALLVTLLAELPLASGLATDISRAALATAEVNAARNGVADRAEFAIADGLDGTAGGFDLVVSNPPYIPSAVIAGLEPEVREHDPVTALDGGPDGLDVYRKIIPHLARAVSSGMVIFEVGAGQADAVATMLTRVFPSAPVHTRRDLGGHNRCVAMEIQL